MLLRIRQDHSFRTRGAVPLPRPSTLMGAAAFNGLYMRPNPSDDGTVPALSPYCSSPDIWLAGTTPVANYQTALATDTSYATSSAANIYSGQGNFIYIRAKNGAAGDSTRTVQLFYAPSGVIQSPSRWQGNIIPTDQGSPTGTIPLTATGSVGVCDSTFLWSDPSPPPSASDHYCLFAWLNDSQNSNPFPSVETVFDMGSLITNNLGWGWRNTTMIPSDSTWQASEPLAIPDTYPTQTYTVQVQPTGWVGWQVEFYCSQRDANGNEIRLKLGTIQQDGQILGVSNVVLDGGFSGQMFVNLYSPDGRQPTPGATIPLSCNYVASTKADVHEAADRGLINQDMMYVLRRDVPAFRVGPTALVIQGSYSWQVSNSPKVLGWWKARGYSPRKGA